MHKSAMDVETMKEIIAKVFTKLYIHNINWLNEGGGQMTDAPPLRIYACYMKLT